ncbi:LysE family translocator [Desulfospira joergensenii]|uniref:LysE family translocator n=1 Tax=Desulfospira joergensenii TaxID=53329 RepID=UPI0003B33722|nr:LysE family transporter [Desulfospira joergensenii]
MIHFLTMGILLGLSAGLSPGPLLALVVSETLQHGTRAGMRVALAPVITDLPIVLAAVFLVSRLAHFNGVLGMISLAGGGVILWMGIQGIRSSGMAVHGRSQPDRSLVKGILVNFLSPHPYLFWISVGGPAVIRAREVSPAAPLFFVGSFYLLLIGSKVGLALIAGKSRVFLKGRAYIFTMKVLGFALCLLALALFREGFRLLGLL